MTRRPAHDHCTNTRCGGCGWKTSTPPNRANDPLCPACHKRRPVQRVRVAKTKVRGWRLDKPLRGVRARRLGSRRIP